MIKKLANAGQTFFKSVTVVVAPVVNPDGYEYSHTNNVLWRKNRQRNSNPSCPGVDLNRNWSAGWGDPTGSSDNPCSETYRGNESFSEPESQALRDLVLAWFDRLTLHLSIHSYGGYILYPWFYTKTDIAKQERLHKIAKRMRKYMWNNGYRRVEVSNQNIFIILTSGGINYT